MDDFAEGLLAAVLRFIFSCTAWQEVEGSPSITSSAVYSDNGNYLVSTTDAAGKVTTYEYDPNTNVLKSVQYPNGEGTKTTYTYDVMYRMLTASAMAGTENLTAAYTYENDLLTKITTGSTTYNFGYGDFALRTSIAVGSNVLATYEYESRTNYLKKLAYGNEDMVEYTYDDLGRVIEQEYEDGDTVTYQYDNNGALATMTDSATGRKTTYYYDFTDRLMKYVESGTDYYHSVGYEYDTLNNLTTLTEVVNGTTRVMRYAYDEDNRIASFNVNGFTGTYGYDEYGRVGAQVLSSSGTTLLNRVYQYHSPSTDITTSQVARINITIPRGRIIYNYTYDDNGNIITFNDTANITTYTYDTQNQLIREDNQAAGKSWTWEYDDAGNILSKSEYAYTTETLGTAVDTVSYAYGNSNWGDLLTSYDGVSISYDAIGNPLYDGTWTYTWEHGRKLASMSNGTSTWSYTYDANGMRTSRTDGTTSYSYVYNESQLVQETITSSSSRSVLNYFYDAGGSPLYVVYNNVPYFYVLNLQGDVVALINTSGTKVVEYTYDAWGNILTTTGSLASTLGQRNALRYRGYVFDWETERYYVSSRYYDPEIGRFINADDVSLLGANGDFASLNFFAYCGNNPVSRSDKNGYLWTNVLIGAGIGLLAGLVGQVISDVITSVVTQTPTISNWQTYAGAALGGAAGGIVLATTGNMDAANAATGFVTTGAAQTLEKLTGANDRDWANIGVNALRDGTMSFAFGTFLSGIPHVTTGRNSLMAIYQSGLSKIRNGIATVMASSVMVKGFIASVAGGLYLDVYYGLIPCVQEE